MAIVARKSTVVSRRNGLGAVASALRACAALVALVSLANAGPAGHESSDGSGSVEGHIQCVAGRHPWVIVVGWGYGAPVDSNGYFQIPSLPAGRHTLLIRGYYCDEVRLPIQVRAGAADFVEVELRCSKLPCPIPDKADPGCILEDPWDTAHVGKPCEVHGRPLRLDIVPIQYGIAGCNVGANGDSRKFPNARVCYSGGCVFGPQRWAEVAYCDKCRAAYYWANPLQLIAPARPFNR